MSKPKASLKPDQYRCKKHYGSTLRFYRMVGLNIPEPIDQPVGALHVESRTDQGLLLSIDNHHLASIYNAVIHKDGDRVTVLTSLRYDYRSSDRNLQVGKGGLRPLKNRFHSTMN